MSKLLQNKKATFNHEILETITAGVKLRGFEVKALKSQRGGSLDGSHVKMIGGELYLSGAHIPEYQVGNSPKGYDSRRDRKLLVTKKELAKLKKVLDTKGLTIVPLSLYNKRSYIKADIAIVRGKKKYDKREIIKKRDIERDIAREYKVR
jgi:SsrA-binding protein